PVSVKGLGSYDHVHTYDIEVEEAHCFYCDGYLTHNSAGMRQGSSEDSLFADAKDNLWQQDESGNWRIDPERDALRMANHTRVFHRKPTLEECLDAVRKQYYSGEGAIQWAGEAVARSNIDLLPTPEL
ncbi:MAG: ribonucleoside-triphosphate reductase, partial [Nostoc sp.]